ncbi:hypothetical protein ACOTI8_31005 [Achromobacter xylosoxidans]|uniref:hypothetical protein n=1 Tax=Alcaligenes xylosoxydans xylosoxydans TaxID=85698 RepID=UPI0009BBAF1B|nr:hypothetical protein [Achromobacter xylosoxidans]
MAHGCEEGDICGRQGCQGVIEFQKPENCSCHLGAPCYSCMSVQLHCPECGWEAQEEHFNDYVVTVNKATGVYEGWRPRPLDPTRIDYRSLPHSSCSMIKEGVYPEGATREEVRALVDGTFGGRFEHFGNGKFRFIAYTD